MIVGGGYRTDSYSKLVCRIQPNGSFGKSFALNQGPKKRNHLYHLFSSSELLLIQSLVCRGLLESISSAGHSLLFPRSHVHLPNPIFENVVWRLSIFQGPSVILKLIRTPLDQQTPKWNDLLIAISSSSIVLSGPGLCIIYFLRGRFHIHIQLSILSALDESVAVTRPFLPLMDKRCKREPTLSGLCFT